ncbi:helix-turn-helix transcriptional regulator [Ralstonia sp. 24A2]|uniref:helix-turn-helix transcriptional regulator n=1 Tax=Ralstonia sp. 24A2 TaxID=3447364 RepID=UPI003F69CBA3
MPMPVTPLAGFDDLPNSAHVDCKTVAALFSTTRTTVWRRSAAGLLPKPRKFGASARWNVGELRAVLAGESVEAK